MKSKLKILSCLASLAICASVTPSFSAMNGTNVPAVSGGLTRGLGKLWLEPTTNPLLIAINENDIDRVGDIIAKDPESVNATFDSGLPALSAAIRNGEREIAQLLINNKADVNRRWVYEKDDTTSRVVYIPDGRTPLYCAADEGDIGMVVLLVQKKADVNARLDNGRTALHRAVENGDIAMVDTLLRLGADVNARDMLGITPADIISGYRAYAGHPILDLLVRNGARISAPAAPASSKFGATPATMTDTEAKPESR